jgi:hypothetical protein
VSSQQNPYAPRCHKPVRRSAPSALVGRERELAELEAGLDDARFGCFFLVTGERGIAKIRRRYTERQPFTHRLISRLMPPPALHPQNVSQNEEHLWSMSKLESDSGAGVGATKD